MKFHCKALVVVALIAALPLSMTAEEGSLPKAEQDAKAGSAAAAGVELKKERESSPASTEKRAGNDPPFQPGKPVYETMAIELRYLNPGAVIEALNALDPARNAADYVVVSQDGKGLYLRTENMIFAKQLREQIQILDAKAGELLHPNIEQVNTRGTRARRRTPQADAEPPQPPKIIRLKHSRAVDLSNTLRNLYPDASNTLNVTSHAPSNSILLRGTGPLLSQFEVLIRQLDESPTVAVGTTAGSDASPGSSADDVPSGLDLKRVMEEFQERDRQAGALAEEIRRLQTADPSAADREQLQKMKSELNERVAEAFDARQNWQFAKLVQMQDRLNRLNQTNKARAEIKPRIIERRIEELLDPDRKWEQSEDAGSPASTDSKSSTSSDREAAGRMVLGLPRRGSSNDLAEGASSGSAGAPDVSPVNARSESAANWRDALIEAEAAVESAKVGAKRARAAVEFRRKTFERIQELNESHRVDEKLVDEKRLQLLEAETGIEQAAIAQHAADRQLARLLEERAQTIKVLELNLAEAKEQLEWAAAIEKTARGLMEGARISSIEYQTKKSELRKATFELQRAQARLDHFRGTEPADETSEKGAAPAPEGESSSKKELR